MGVHAPLPIFYAAAADIAADDAREIRCEQRRGGGREEERTQLTQHHPNYCPSPPRAAACPCPYCSLAGCPPASAVRSDCRCDGGGGERRRPARADGRFSGHTGWRRTGVIWSWEEERRA